MRKIPSLLRANGSVNGKEVAKLIGRKVVPLSRFFHHGPGCWNIYAIRGKNSGRVGWVVGLTWLRSGVISVDYYINGGKSSMLDYYCEKEKRKPALQVCYWPGLRPVLVPLDGWRLALDHEKPISAQRKYFDDLPKQVKDRIRHDRRENQTWR